MIRKERGKQRYQVSDIEDLFFYTLYNFKADWIAGEIYIRIANRVKQQYGYDISKFKLVLRSEDIRHIFNRHFNEKAPNQKNISVNDIKHILRLVNYCDSLALDVDERIVFKKLFPNGEYSFVVEIDERNKRLLGKTFWIKA